jgi:hypothetical protein
VRLTLCSSLLAGAISLVITAILYFNLGMPILNAQNIKALSELFKFWFPISWSLTLLIAMFRSIKYIFNNCYSGYELKLLTCQSSKQKEEILQAIGYGDLVIVWRRWIMTIIWLVGAQMILALVYTILFTATKSLFEWFNIYWLFSFVLLAGYFSFILLSSRCKRVRLAKC